MDTQIDTWTPINEVNPRTGNRIIFQQGDTHCRWCGLFFDEWLDANPVQACNHADRCNVRWSRLQKGLPPIDDPILKIFPGQQKREKQNSRVTKTAPKVEQPVKAEPVKSTTPGLNREKLLARLGKK